MTEQHDFYQASVRRHEDEIHLSQGEVTIRISQPMADAFADRIKAISGDIQRENAKEIIKQLADDLRGVSRSKPNLKSIDGDSPEAA